MTTQGETCEKISVPIQQGQSERRIGYARVSTDRQTTDQQVYALRRAGCAQVFVDDENFTH